MVKRPTLHFGSGHDLMVSKIEPCFQLYTDSEGPAWDSLSASLPLNQSINQLKKECFLSNPDLQIIFQNTKQKKKMRDFLPVAGGKQGI